MTLAKLIATSRFLKGLSVQAFGLYAAERSGAPIQAFCRYSSETITNRNLIYTPDHVVVLDPTLVGPSILAGLRPGGWILLNTTADVAELLRVTHDRVAAARLEQRRGQDRRDEEALHGRRVSTRLRHFDRGSGSAGGPTRPARVSSA